MQCHDSVLCCRAGDDHSACSSCSSGGLAYELARKCTLSADSLLLHPDVTSESRVTDFGRRCAEEPMARTRSSHHRHHLQPESAAQGKMMSSLSSDQIHSHLATSGPIDGTRSASPKLAVKKSTPEPIEEMQASTSQAGAGRDEKRKGSVASQVFSRPGRLARLLRRTHSAGCSKDVPPYAIFLREKVPVSAKSKINYGWNLSDCFMSPMCSEELVPRNHLLVPRNDGRGSRHRESSFLEFSDHRRSEQKERSA